MMDSAFKAWQIALIAFMLVVGIGGIASIVKEEQLKNDIPIYIEEGYNVYLDGEMIDPNTIDFGHYEISVDENKQSIFLTKRAQKDSDSTFFPIIIPFLQ